MISGINVTLHLLGRPLPPPAITVEHTDGTPAAPDSDDQMSEDGTDILGITIHGTDELQASVFLTHPSVRVSIFDASIDNFGNFLKKSAPEKCVTSYYERGNPSVDYILPVLTQPYECRQHRYNCTTDESLQTPELVADAQWLQRFCSRKGIVYQCVLAVKFPLNCTTCTDT